MSQLLGFFSPNSRQLLLRSHRTKRMRLSANKILESVSKALWDLFPHHNNNPETEKMNTSLANSIIAYSSTLDNS